MPVFAKAKQKPRPDVKLAVRGARALTRNVVQCYVFGPQGLLLYKSEKDLGIIEGEIKSGESPQQAAARTIYEKTGIVANTLQLDGEMLFVPNTANGNLQRKVFVISCNDFSGNANSNAAWIRNDEAIKHLNNCEALVWPLVFLRKKFRARFIVGASCDEIISYQLDEL